MYDYSSNPLYNPMINPYLGVQRPYQQQPKQEVVKVNGENGARAFPLGANSSALSGVMRFPSAWTFAGGNFPPLAAATA